MLLSVDKLCAGYGPLQVLHEVSFQVDVGEIVTIIGPNGAGKSTTLRALSRLIPVMSGGLRHREVDLRGLKPHQVARRGIAHVPEGRGVFGNLTVEENLKLATLASPGPQVARRLAAAYQWFPQLADRRRQLASTLSGGEQQMLAMGRAVVANGELFVLDEPSMGLSPLLVKNVFSIITALNARGKAVLLVEQNVNVALSCAHRAYVLENGRIVAQGSGQDLLHDDRVRRAYLG